MSIHTDRRFGRFTVSHVVLQDMPVEEAGQLFAGLVVVRAESKFAEDAIEYTAWCADFAPVPMGGMIPRYTLTLDQGDTEAPRRHWSGGTHD